MVASGSFAAPTSHPRSSLDRLLPQSRLSAVRSLAAPFFLSSSIRSLPAGLTARVSVEVLRNIPSAAFQSLPAPQARRMGSPLRLAAGAPAAPTGASIAELLGGENIAPDAVLVAVLGDLHLEPAQMPLFNEARDQIVRLLEPYGPALGTSCPVDAPQEAASTAWPNNPRSAAESIAVGGPRAQDRRLLVQLGDVGGYSCAPGSRECFRGAVRFLNSFYLPRLSVTGNHDLEGAEFASDEANLAAWLQEFGHQRHHWSKDLGPAGVALGLSTVRFRAAPASCHEVFVDNEQMEWFQEQLQQHAGRPVFVFTHAPPMGSGLTSLQTVHVRNRCAWLNHSSSTAPEFLSLVQRHANIRLWFSGHFHLSHDYEGSLSLLNRCLFVQTGVMGACNRDGRRHSRLLVASSAGYHLLTVDHNEGEARVDVAHSYAEEARGVPPQRLWCSTLSLVTSCPGGGPFAPAMPEDIRRRDASQFPPAALAAVEEAEAGQAQAAPRAGGGAAGGAVMRSRSHWGGGVALGLAEGALDLGEGRAVGGPGAAGAPAVRWHAAGGSVFAEHANQLVEYDRETHAPIGIVCDRLNGRSVRLVVAGGGAGVAETGKGRGGVSDGAVVAVEIAPAEGAEGEVERVERNSQGTFSRIFQVNKWKKKMEEAARAAAAASDAAAAAAAAATASAAPVASAASVAAPARA